MSEVVIVKLSPNRSNIMYVERRRTDLETDFSESLSTLKEKQKDTLRVIVYCRTLMICADLFSRFSYEMWKSQYYPPELSENRLFGMFHASTPQHSKDVIMGSLQDCHGTVRVVFASVAMGMGIESSTMVLQAVLKTISKLVVEEAKWRFSLLHSLLDT